MFLLIKYEVEFHETAILKVKNHPNAEDHWNRNLITCKSVYEKTLEMAA